ncbi:hypothetical protein ACIRQP_39415 [Streptomyces sp. NPDC102274]|uniref:hypothetical protein n=1 Tax=Streptomyces sp. NPDC102274 TaxID=3366151 RepID=UPI0037F56710
MSAPERPLLLGRSFEGFDRALTRQLAKTGPVPAVHRLQARWFTRSDQGPYGTVLAGYPDEHHTVHDFLTQMWSRGAELTDTEGRLSLDSARFLYDQWHTDRVVDPAAVRWDSVASSGRSRSTLPATFRRITVICEAGAR